MKKKISRGKLIKKVDAEFSKYIRKKYADWRGYCKCYTCGKSDKIEKMQCGHYKPRSHFNTRYDEENCRVQCVACNIFKRGNYTKFALELTREKGFYILEELEKRANILKQWTVPELLELIDDIKEKTNRLM